MNTLVDENRDRDRAQTEQFVVPSASGIEAADGYTLDVEMPGVNKEGLEIFGREQRADDYRPALCSQGGRSVASS